MVKSMSLVRRTIVFKPKELVRLSYEYQHDVMKSIYYYLSIADEQKEKFLHNEGYKKDDRPGFKLFNFTLRFSKARFTKEYIEVDEDGLLLLIISGRDDIVNDILKGLLHIKNLRVSNCDIPLQDIENNKNAYFKDVMLYKALSPIVTTVRAENGYVVSLKPYTGKYYENLANNLKKKYEFIYEEEFRGELYFDIDDVLNMRQKSHKIKNIYKLGFLYDVWIETTPKMHRIIYYLGLGENTSTGAGCVDIKGVGRGE